MTTESGPLHRLFLDGGLIIYMSEVEHEATKRMTYYCPPCAAYHLRPEFTEQEFITALNAPFDEQKGENAWAS